MNAITATFKEKSLEFVKYLPSYLPYKLGKKEDVLILEPKGGLQALVAKKAEAKNIYKIESNPLLLKVIKEDYKDFSGDIFGSKAYTGLGRSWLKANKKKFDIIDISLTGTAPSGAFGISEDYRFTIEAFKEYIEHLKPDGILSLNLFIIPPPRIELRLLSTIIFTLEKINIKEPQNHIVSIRSWGSIIILIKKSRFTEEEIEEIKRFSKEKRFDLLYYPDIKAEETNIFIRMPTNEYFEAFKNIITPETRNKFIKDYIFDISPVYDDKPFFNYYLKLKNIKDTYNIMGKKWQFFIEEGYILPILFVQVLFLGLLIMIVPALFLTKKINNLFSIKTSYILFYFIFLGIGFMFVEIPLIQKVILPLENASFAFATTIASMLISSGIGSLLSHKFVFLRKPHINLIIGIIAIIYSLFFPIISDQLSYFSISIRIVAVFLVFMPLGFFMGIPFPLGIKELGNANSSLIPWAWAINGSFSVLAPIMAIMIAMIIGFKAVLWLGALSYVMAFVSLYLFSHSPSDSS